MKNRQLIYAFILSVFTMFSFLPISVAQTSNIGTRIVGTGALNVRSQPWVGNNIIDHFNKGDKVTVIKKDSTGNWCQVEYKNTNEAWVYCPFLMKEQTASTDEQHRSAWESATVNVSALNVRSAPSMGRNIIGYLNRNDSVTIKERDSSTFWCKIDFKDQPNAWVACSYLKNIPSTDEKHRSAAESANVNVSALNVRSAPSMGRNIIGYLNRNDSVTIKERDASNFWCKIDFKDHPNAWVACKFVKKQ